MIKEKLADWLGLSDVIGQQKEEIKRLRCYIHDMDENIEKIKKERDVLRKNLTDACEEMLEVRRKISEAKFEVENMQKTAAKQSDYISQLLEEIEALKAKKRKPRPRNNGQNK